MTKSNVTSDLVSAVILLVLGGVIYVASARIPPSLLDDRFGAGLLPKLLAVGAIGLALCLGAAALCRASASEPEVKSGQAPRGKYVKLASVVAALVVFITALDFQAPFLPAGIAFMFAMTVILGRWSIRSTATAAVFAVGVTLGVEVAFTRIFTVFLP